MRQMNDLAGVLLLDEAQVRWFALVLVFAGFAAWEAVAPQRDVDRIAPRWGVVVVLLVLGSLLTRAVFPVLTVGMAAIGESARFGLLHRAHWPWLAESVVAIVLLDLSRYWEHRLLHRVPWFWRLHRAHHSDPEFDCSTALRFHPLEAPLTMAMHAVAIAAIGPSPATVLAYEIFFVLGAAWAHANVRVPARLEAGLRPIFVTPGLHAIHHSTGVGDADRNFSAVSIVWDRIFGTYAATSAHPGPMGFGLRDLPAGRRNAIGWLLLLPFRRLPPQRPGSRLTSP